MAQAVVDVNTLLAINQVIACARLVARAVTLEHSTLALAALRFSLTKLDEIIADDPEPF